MRSRLAIIAVLGALLLSLGVVVPTASAAPANPKVVIIVGATHGTTPSYRAKADQAYAEARKYTSNVIKVYSPNATWSKVKSATTGASIVVYFGHGNGWPSPYTYDSKYTTKDGFGLNSAAGDGDYNNKYYGEPYVSTLDLAPHAVVILSNLCYASGNSEPGDAAPSQTTARKRVDNYGAGFLKAADAVIADGHGSPEPYIRALFTTHATIDDVWRTAPNYHGHELTFPSSRTKGAVAFTDTDSTASGYYRSLVWKPGLTTDQVTGASYADTGVDPSTLQVPGNAAVGSDGATLEDGTGAAIGSLPAGTRLRTVETGTVGDPAVPVVHVTGIDDTSIDGWVDPAALLPRDSRAPAVWGIDTGGGVFSPNGDGRFDTAPISARFSESVDWRIRVLEGTTVLDQWTGTGDRASVEWDGLDGTAARPDGRYDVEVRVQDAWQNGPTTATTHVTIDTVPDQLQSLTEDTDPLRWFSPDGDGTRDTVSLTASTDERGSFVVRAYADDGTRVRSTTVDHAAGASTVTWDGRDDAGHVVPDGIYRLLVTPRDATGTNGTTLTRHVRIDTTLGSTLATKPLFYPQDLDTLATATAITFRLTEPASVRVSLLAADSSEIGDVLAATPMEPGTVTVPFDGHLADGSAPGTGTYRVIVRATTDAGTVAQSIELRMMAFRVTASDNTPGRGQRLSVTALSAESLAKPPRLYIDQPGLARWSVAMSKTATSTFKATITLKSGGKAGSVRFRVVGTDARGGSQATYLVVPIH